MQMLNKLVISSLKRNRQVYLPYLLSVLVLGALNYIFYVLMANSSLQDLESGFATNVLLQLGSWIVIILTAAFMIYANNFIARRREQEMGLYSMLGMTSKNLIAMIGLEKLYLLLAGLAGSVVVGQIFEKIAFQSYAKLLKLTKVKEGWLSLAAIGKTASLLAALFACLFILDAIKVKSMTPRQLWNSGKKATKVGKKTPYLGGAIGVILVGWGYWLAVTTKPTASALMRFFGAAFLVIAGTYFVFIAASVVLLKFLQTRKRYYYQPKHFIAVSGLLQRMRANGASLASVCLMVSAVMVVLFGSISGYSGKEEALKSWSPKDVVIQTEKPLLKRTRAYIKKTSVKAGAKRGPVTEFKMADPVFAERTGNQLKVSRTFSSTANTSLMLLDQANYQKLTGQKISLKGSQALVHARQSRMGTSLTIYGKEYQIKQLDQFKWAYNPDHVVLEPVWVIVKTLPKQAKPVFVYAYNYRIAGSSLKQRLNYEKRLAYNLSNVNASPINFTGAAMNESMYTGLMGGVIMIGLMISVALILTTAVVIYFKQVSEAYADRSRFVTMQQVGLSEQESSQAIHVQVLLIFFFPLAGGLLNMLIAAPAVKKVLYEFSIYNSAMMLKVAFWVTVAVFAFYLAIYAITTRVYRRIVG
jgi:putative ABC transport system permease protein